MLKHWFEFSSNGNGSAGLMERRNGTASAVLDRDEPVERERPPAASRATVEERKDLLSSEDRPDFEQIYRGAMGKPAQVACGILRVVEMMNSPHLIAMPVGGGRRC